MVIPFRDFDKVVYVYANDEYDAVYIYNKMCGCLVPETIAQPIYGIILEQGYEHKKNSIISFKKQCELNSFGDCGENPIVEE